MPLLASLFDKLSSGPEHVNNTSFRAVKFDKGLSDDCKLLRMIYMHLCGMFWTPPVFLLQILVQKSVLMANIKIKNINSKNKLIILITIIVQLLKMNFCRIFQISTSFQHAGS